MEDHALNGLRWALWDREQIKVAARGFAEEFGVPEPRIIFTDIGSYAGDYVDGRIRLSTTRRGRSPLVFMHELAHHVVDTWDPDSRLEGHGPEFAGVYGDILALSGLCPLEGFRAIARQYGVRVLDTSEADSIPKLRKLVYKRTQSV